MIGEIKFSRNPNFRTSLRTYLRSSYGHFV